MDEWLYRTENDSLIISSLRFSQIYCASRGGPWNYIFFNCFADDCRTPTLHNKFQDMLHDHGLAQIVEDTTHDRNTLDLICTNLPGKINKTEVIPGISDHCIPTAEVDVRPIKRQQKPLRIHLYKKAEWTKMAEELGNVQEQIEQQQHSKTTNELWLMFKDASQKLLRSIYPARSARNETDSHISHQRSWNSSNAGTGYIRRDREQNGTSTTQQQATRTQRRSWNNSRRRFRPSWGKPTGATSNPL